MTSFIRETVRNDSQFFLIQLNLFLFLDCSYSLYSLCSVSFSFQWMRNIQWLLWNKCKTNICREKEREREGWRRGERKQNECVITTVQMNDSSKHLKVPFKSQRYCLIFLCVLLNASCSDQLDFIRYFMKYALMRLSWSEEWTKN